MMPSELLKNIAGPSAVALVLVAVHASNAFTQDAPRNRLTVSAGVTHLAHQDLIHTPFIHRGVSPMSLGVVYERDGSWSHFMEMHYAAVSSTLATYLIEMHGHENLPHTYLLMNATYGVGRRLSSRSETEAVGAALKLDVQGAFYNYGTSSNFGYFMSPSMNVWYRRDIRLNERHRLSGRASVPVLSWVARSPYLVNDDQFIENIASNNRFKSTLAFIRDGELVGWNRLQRFDLTSRHHYAITRRSAVGAFHQFAFIHSTEPRPLTSVQNNVGLITTFHF